MTEVEVPNFPNYTITKEGIIKNAMRNTVVSQWTTTNGYLAVTLYRANKPYSIRVHKMMAKIFLGVPLNTYVRHKDGNKVNNALDNLEAM